MYTFSNQISVMIDVFSMVIMIILILSTTFENKVIGKPTSKFIYLSLVAFFIALFHMLIVIFNKDEYRVLEYMFNCVLLLLIQVIPIFYLRYVISYVPYKRRMKVIIHTFEIVVTTMIIVYLIMLIVNYNNYIDFDGKINYAKFYSIFIITPTLCCAAIYVMILGTKYLTRIQKLLFSSFSFLLILALIGQFFYQKVTAIIPASISFSLFIIYIYLFIEMSTMNQLQKAQIMEQQMVIALSQIKPHFIYNALSSIAALCLSNPNEAYNCTIEFSSYLRSNLDSLSYTKPIPFTKEMEHVRNYLNIEKRRFPNKLNVIYDIKCEDFLIPALTIEPLVENAVKCGISSKLEGGTLTIKSFEVDNFYVVKVIDDGNGFNPNEIKKDGRTHIGIENVKNRLDKMVHGSLIIDSRKGLGTTITIIVPKK